ncbi:MAG: AsmA family protein [Bacteroidales bacterium]|nr:AsmA family protein [Bacteroidales bacterium]
MKKPIKVTLISLASLIGLVLITMGVLCWLIFTPARLTRMVNKEAPRFITCNFHLDKAELTFFKTFPQVGLDLHNVTLINPMFGAPSDTLLRVQHCTADLNIRELLKNKHIEVKNFLLEDGAADLYVNKDGKNNFSVFKTDTTAPSAEFDYTIDLQKVATQNVDVRFVNLHDNIVASLADMDLKAKGQWANKSGDGKIDISTNKLKFNTLDSNAINVSCNNMALQFDGNLKNMDQTAGQLNLDIQNLLFHVGDNNYLDSLDLSLGTDFSLSIANQRINIKDLLLKLDQYQVNLKGTAKRDTLSGDVAMDLQYQTQKWPLKEIIALIPRAIIGDALDSMDMDGNLGLAGKIYGHYNEQQKPIITADADWSEGTFAMSGFPLDFHNISTLFHVDMDLNNQTDVTIQKLDCYTGNNHLTACGNIKDLLDKMLFDITATGELHLPDFKSMLPEALTRCNGNAQATLSAKFDYDQLSKMAIDEMQAKGYFHFSDLDLIYDDSLTLQSPSMFVDVQFPVTETPYHIGEWAEANIKAQKLTASKIGLGNISASGTALHAFVNDLMDSTLSLKMGTTFQFETLSAKMDTIDAYLKAPKGTFTMKGERNLTLQYAGESLLAHYGQGLTAQSGPLTLDAKTNYDETGYNTLMQWNPSAKMNLKNGILQTSAIELPINLSTVDVNFNMRKCNIQEASGTFGNSDFALSGKVLNIDKYFLGQDLLTGTLELVSNYIDINQIIDVVNGLGAPDTLLAEVPENQEDNPFIVPYGIDLRMHTLIQKAHYEDVDIRNIGGYLSVKDGILVLDEMGFTSDAARMQLTALYKTPRKNHLFLGLDFHLLDIKIAELIQMIPEVDTVLPMLKSFAGNAEFHFAIETYLKSNYDLKYSTLRGAAAINGQDLVVLDNDTYKKISKLLMFKKNTPNKIDSLAAELTIFKNEIDVYPFAVSIDKYQAILSGRHKLDMTYDYNISLIKPLRIGLDIIGTDKRKFKVGKAKYATLFKPEKQNVVEQNVLQLKSQINQALKANVKEQPVERP